MPWSCCHWSKAQQWLPLKRTASPSLLATFLKSKSALIPYYSMLKGSNMDQSEYSFPSTWGCWLASTALGVAPSLAFSAKQAAMCEARELGGLKFWPPYCYKLLLRRSLTAFLLVVLDYKGQVWDLWSHRKKFQQHVDHEKLCIVQLHRVRGHLCI